MSIKLICFLITSIFIFLYFSLSIFYDWAYTNGWCDAFKKAGENMDEINLLIQNHIKNRLNKRES